jgi:hypothetical protein
MPGRTALLLVVIALASVSPAPLHLWQLENLQLKQAPISSRLHVIRVEASSDLDRDGVPEILTLSNGRASILTGGRTRWQSPPAWQVVQAQVTDLNHDGLAEITLLVWRPFKPWPVDTWLPSGGRIKNFHDSKDRSCHVILIGWKQGVFRELWAGSALAEPVKSFAVANLMENDRQYLVALTGQYDDAPSALSRRLKVWEWNGFGFTVVNELEDSSSRLVPVQTEDGRIFILTD